MSIIYDDGEEQLRMALWCTVSCSCDDTTRRDLVPLVTTHTPWVCSCVCVCVCVCSELRVQCTSVSACPRNGVVSLAYVVVGEGKAEVLFTSLTAVSHSLPPRSPHMPD